MKKTLFVLLVNVPFLVYSQFGKDLLDYSRIQVEKDKKSRESQYMLSLSTPLLTPPSVVAAGNFTFNLGGGLRFYESHAGLVELNYYRNAFITETTEDPAYHATDNISHDGYSFVINGNILKKEVMKSTELGVSGLPGNYYTVLDVVHKRALNLRAGYGRTFSNSYSDAYSKILWQNPDFHPVRIYGTNTSCWIEQATMDLKLGLSFTEFVNYKFEGEFEGKAISASKSQLINCYLDVNIAKENKAEISRALYTYYANGDANSSGPENPLINEKVDMTNYLGFRKLGLSLGVERVVFMNKANSFNITSALEFGTRTGYFDNALRSAYMELKFVCFGVGKLSKP